MKHPLLLATLLACAMNATADPVYKCAHAGKVSYSDRPCANGPSIELAPPALGVDLEGRNAVPTRDARQLLEIEKLRIAREKDAERLRDQREAREQREHQRARLAAAKTQKQCERLKLRARWAEEDAAKARGQKREAALLKARRQAETLAVECPA